MPSTTVDKTHTNHPTAAIFFDWDDTLSTPPRTDPKNYDSYVVDKNGFIGGTLIDLNRTAALIQRARENKILLAILTARPPRELHRNYIKAELTKVNGFHPEGIGGFLEDSIYCLGIEEEIKELGRLGVVRLIKETKLRSLQEIHLERLSHLPRYLILFVEDALHNLNPVKEAGYSTIHALNETHFAQVMNFINATNELPFLSRLGNQAVLIQEHQIPLYPLDNTEILEPAALTGYFWRKRIIPDLALLAKRAVSDADKKAQTAAHLTALNLPQAICFTEDSILIEKHLGKYGYTIEQLAEKELILLVASEGTRKLEPLKKSLVHSSFDLDKVAIIGLPADSGVAAQPVGHKETQLGCINRIQQAECFKQSLENLLRSKGHTEKKIACLAIENGIGLYPVEHVASDGSMVLADPILDEEGIYHFYDQAHIVLSNAQGARTYLITEPMAINYTLMSRDIEELKAYFSEGKPTDAYYLKQSEYNEEMVRRRKSDVPESAYPYRKEGATLLNSNALIERTLIPAVHKLKAPISSAQPEDKIISSIKPHSSSNISLHILGGFIAAIGCTAVAVAFTVLNAATLGIPGLVVAGLGIAAVLSGVGLFAHGICENSKPTMPGVAIGDGAIIGTISGN